MFDWGSLIGPAIGGIGSFLGGALGGEDAPPQAVRPMGKEGALILAELMSKRKRPVYRAPHFPNAPQAVNYGELLRQARGGGGY
jgi:hypothetical protein